MLSWSSSSKYLRIFWSKPLKNIEISNAHNFGKQVWFQKFQLCYAQKPEIFSPIKFREFWWGSDEKSPFCWITWYGMTQMGVPMETKQVSVQVSLSTNIYCDKFGENFKFKAYSWMLPMCHWKCCGRPKRYLPIPALNQSSCYFKCMKFQCWESSLYMFLVKACPAFQQCDCILKWHFPTKGHGVP